MASNDQPTVQEADCVEDMVRSYPSCVPGRYIRSEQDKAKDVDRSVLSAEIPIVDLALLSDGHEKELNKLDKACQEWGFFQVINHGIPTGTIHRMKTAAAEFFKLPAQEKKKYPYDPNVLEGYGTPYPLSENESVDWSSALFLRLSPIQQRKLELWPTTPPELKDTVEAYSAEVAKVNKKLLGCLSLIMGMERNALFELHEEMSMLLRVTYYPTCCMPDQVLGLGPHSDASSITLLAQDDDVTGLQVLHDGGWVPVKPIPNALVVNIGDVMEIWSNGRYKSIDHRVVTTVEKARTSYASFVAPHKDVVMEPLEQMLDAQHRHGMYHKVKYENYLKYVLHRKLEGKAHMAKYTI